MDFTSAPELLVLLPLVVGLVEAVKALGIPHRFAPLAPIVLGIGLAFLVMPTMTAVILGGTTLGLMASGLYLGVRAMVSRWTASGRPKIDLGAPL